MAVDDAAVPDAAAIGRGDQEVPAEEAAEPVLAAMPDGTPVPLPPSRRRRDGASVAAIGARSAGAVPGDGPAESPVATPDAAADAAAVAAAVATPPAAPVANQTAATAAGDVARSVLPAPREPSRAADGPTDDPRTVTDGGPGTAAAARAAADDRGETAPAGPRIDAPAVTPALARLIAVREGAE
ncbi:MAG: hypothetical protein AAFR52_14470 [Pseudomonadota bacterium]